MNEWMNDSIKWLINKFERRKREGKWSKKQIRKKRKKRCYKYWAQIIKHNCKLYSFIILQVYYKYYCCLFNFVQNWLHKYKFCIYKIFGTCHQSFVSLPIYNWRPTMSTAYKMYGHIYSLFPYKVSNALLQNFISYCTKYRVAENCSTDVITLSYILQYPS